MLRRWRGLADELRSVLALVIGGLVVMPIAGLALYVSSIHSANPLPRPILQAYVTEELSVGLRWSADSAPVTVQHGWQYQVKEGLGDYGSWISVPGGAAARSVVPDLPDNGIMMAFRARAMSGGRSGPLSNEVWVDLTSAKVTAHLAKIAERCVDCAAPPTEEPLLCESPVQLGVFYFRRASSELYPAASECGVGVSGAVDGSLDIIHEHLRTTGDHVLVEGYASYPGAQEYNLGLSETRAEAIVQRLLDREPGHCGRLHVVANGEDAGGHVAPSECRRMVRVLACRNVIETTASRFCGVCEEGDECPPSAG